MGNFSNTRRLIPATILLAALCAAHAQDPNQQPTQQPDQPLPTLKLSTRIVAVSAVVLDSRGEPVRDLTKDDFILKQDGKEQEIRYFSQDSTLPLTLALMVDTSESQRMFISDETIASEKFFRAMLTRPSDRAALVQFDTTVLELRPMTAQLQALENSLNFLSMPHPSGRGATLLYDAIVAASAHMLGPERGRRAMVILTDGEDHGSHATLEEAIAAAQRADTAVYAVLYSAEAFMTGGAPRHTIPGQPSGRNVLDQISNSTGGHVFTVSRQTPLDLIYSQIADDMRLQYQIGYTPPESAPGSYHKIELRPKGKHLAIQARVGYYTPK
jgi:Ca-activated chloride channel family protein